MVNRLYFIFGNPVYFPEVSDYLDVTTNLVGVTPIIENYFSLIAGKRPSQGFSVACCIASESKSFVNAHTNHRLDIVTFHDIVTLDTVREFNIKELIHLAEERIIGELSCPLIDEIKLLEFKRIADSVMCHKDQLALIVESNPSFGKSHRKLPARNQMIPAKCRKPYGKSYGMYTLFNGRFYSHRK